MEFEEGRAAANPKGKDLLIEFGGSDWRAPCVWLKERILSRTEFIDRATGTFVLVEIDLPVRSPVRPVRKRWNEELLERHGIASVPMLVLAKADDRLQTQTTHREAFQAMETFWNSRAPLSERGRRLHAAPNLSRAFDGDSRAAELANGLSEIDPRFLSRIDSTAWTNIASPTRRT